MKIYVDTIEQKIDLLEQSEYIHDFMEIFGDKVIGLDSDKANTLMHIYMNPDMIIVGEPK